MNLNYDLKDGNFIINCPKEWEFYGWSAEWEGLPEAKGVRICIRPKTPTEKSIELAKTAWDKRGEKPDFYLTHEFARIIDDVRAGLK